MKIVKKLMKLISKKNTIKVFEICVGLILSLGLVAIIHDVLKSMKKDKEGIENKEDDDRYILKSEVVPPVCPKCPDAAVCPKQEACPPCPPCERCPEPSFTCKKVPNYQSDAVKNNHSLPLGYLNSFEQF